MSTHTFPVDIVLLPHHPKDAHTPVYATAGSAGCDLVAAIPDAIEVGAEPVLIPTGIMIAVPVGFEAQVRPRSGMSLKHGIIVVNAPGTIDSDYRGEIKVIMYTLPRVYSQQVGDGAFSNVIVPQTTTIKPGDRIAQLVFAPCWRAEWRVLSGLNDTERAAKGFGSTGVK
jgi:dUTP pyrophosphatase